MSLETFESKYGPFKLSARKSLSMAGCCIREVVAAGFLKVVVVLLVPLTFHTLSAHCGKCSAIHVRRSKFTGAIMPLMDAPSAFIYIPAGGNTDSLMPIDSPAKPTARQGMNCCPLS